MAGHVSLTPGSLHLLAVALVCTQSQLLDLNRPFSRTLNRSVPSWQDEHSPHVLRQCEATPAMKVHLYGLFETHKQLRILKLPLIFALNRSVESMQDPPLVGVGAVGVGAVGVGAVGVGAVGVGAVGVGAVGVGAVGVGAVGVGAVGVGAVGVGAVPVPGHRFCPMADQHSLSSKLQQLPSPTLKHSVLV